MEFLVETFLQDDEPDDMPLHTMAEIDQTLGEPFNKALDVYRAIGTSKRSWLPYLMLYSTKFALKNFTMSWSSRLHLLCNG